MVVRILPRIFSMIVTGNVKSAIRLGLDFTHKIKIVSNEYMIK